MSASASSAVQRAGPLARLPQLLARYGVPPEKVFDGLPVTPEELHADLFLPMSVISALLDRAAAHDGLETVGLQLGRDQNHAGLGPIGELMASCETLGSALGSFVALHMTNSTAAATYLHPLGDDYALGFVVYAPDLPSSHLYDAAAAVGVNILRDLTGGQVRPVEVLLSRPVPADPEVYRRQLLCPVRFNEEQSCLIINGRDMGVRLPSANAQARESLLASLQRQLAQQAPGFAARVKHALRPLLLAGRASHREVAAHLNIHPRTMGRRLEDENVTFEQLKDETRLTVSRELLARTEVAVSDIAASLGYATPSAFVRAFRRWTGQSPSAWRKAARNGGT